MLPNTLIGREQDIAALQGRLLKPECRLLSIVGSGGMGKTRLGLELANRLAGHYDDGAHVIGLAPLASADQLPSALANALNLQIMEEDFAPQLTNMLAGKHALLMLDNFEHLLDAALMVSEIIAAVPGIDVLVTSREPLNLVEEWIYRIEGLSHSDAVALFNQRAGQAQHQFSPQHEHTTVERICALLDGMPLAIELAAAMRRTRTSEQILRELIRGIDALQSSLRNIPERHRSIRAVFDHSWMGLAEAERDVFMRLSVFQGTFTLEAAEEITGAMSHTLDVLVEKSLLAIRSDGRYSLHELLRQYGAEKLTGAGLDLRADHSAYYLRLLTGQEARLKSADQLPALALIDAEFENIRAAWLNAVVLRDWEQINRALDACYWYGLLRSRLQEINWLFDQAIEAHPPEVVLHRLLIRRIVYYFDPQLSPDFALSMPESSEDAAYYHLIVGLGKIMHSAYTDALSHLQAARAAYETMDNQFYLSHVYYALGLLYFSLFDAKQSEQFNMMSVELRRELGERSSLAWSLVQLSVNQFNVGAMAEAGKHSREAYELWAALDNREGMVLALSNLSYYQYLVGGFAEFHKLALESEQLAADIYSIVSRNRAKAIAGVSAMIEQDYPRAIDLLKQGLAVPDKISQPNGQVAMALSYLGAGDHEAARRILIEGFRPIAHSRMKGYLFLFNGVASQLLQDVLPPEQIIEYIGSSFAFLNMSPDEAFVWMQQFKQFYDLYMKTVEQLSPDAWQEAWQRGCTIDMTVLAERSMRELEKLSGTAARTSRQQQPLVDPLTERETEILRLIAQGLSNEAIADQLVVGISTVKKHINHLYSKLDVTSRTQCIARARELGLV